MTFQLVVLAFLILDVLGNKHSCFGALLIELLIYGRVSLSMTWKDGFEQTGCHFHSNCWTGSANRIIKNGSVYFGS